MSRLGKRKSTPATLPLESSSFPANHSLAFRAAAASSATGLADFRSAHS